VGKTDGRPGTAGTPRLRHRSDAIGAPVETIEGRRPWPALLAAGILLVAAAHALLLRFVCDDAYIAFRYASNLSHGHGLTFNPGERVEGYTSFLWTIIASGVITLGGRPDLWMPALGLGAALALVAWLMWVQRSEPAAALTSGGLLAASTTFTAWSTGGLETAMFTALVTVGVFSLPLALDRAVFASAQPTIRRPLLLSAGLLGSATLVRPEAFLVTAVAGIVLLLALYRRRVTGRGVILWCGVWVACALPVLLWKHAYYGHWLPQTYLVKSPGFSQFSRGLRYLARAALHTPLLLAAPVVLSLALTRLPITLGRWTRGTAVAYVITVLLYVGTTGGDFMPAFRFCVPVLPAIALLAGPLLIVLATAATGPARRAAGLGGVVALLLGYAFINGLETRRTLRPPAGRAADSIELAREQVRDWREVGELLRDLSMPGDTLATTAAGVIPYTSGLYTIDMLGLTAADLSGYLRQPDALPGHALAIGGEELVRLRPQFLLGHPLVRDEPGHEFPSVVASRRWGQEILRMYEPIKLGISEDTTRYVVCAVRRDVVPRLRQR
jgi:arabinofuranosyltransferase